MSHSSLTQDAYGPLVTQTVHDVTWCLCWTLTRGCNGTWKWVLSIAKGFCLTGEMAQPVKCRQLKHEDMSSIPRSGGAHL